MYILEFCKFKYIHKCIYLNFEYKSVFKQVPPNIFKINVRDFVTFIDSKTSCLLTTHFIMKYDKSLFSFNRKLRYFYIDLEFV